MFKDIFQKKMLIIFATFCFSHRLALPPFRIRLEDKRGMQPSIYRTYDSYTEVQQYTQFPVKYSSTMSGHVLVAYPMNEDKTFYDETPLLKYAKWKDDDICLTDGMRLFNASVPCFTCFVTGEICSEGYAPRIEDSYIWILTSSCYGLVECNECSCKLSRREFAEIQKGFLKLLL